MLEQFHEKELRQKILESVAEYYKIFHQRENDSNSYLPYAGRVYDHHEMMNLVDSALDFWLTAGKWTDQFERNFAKFLDAKYCSVVNSGSSANLVAFMSLTSPLLKERAIQRGDEVITVAAGFPTTVAPMIQYGAIPVFVDVTIPEYNIDVGQLEKALSKKTKAVMIAHTLGNPFDLKEVKRFCDKHELWLIEDNCDALGSEYCLDGKWKYTGTIGDFGTSSFYPPHHITMGEGGAVYTDNPLLHKISRSLRDWGRDCQCPSGHDNICGHRFDGQFGELPLGYDHKYVYSHFGYNFKATDMQAAIGVAQLEKLPGFIQKRRENFQFLKDNLKDFQDKVILPQATKHSNPSWFGFPITLKQGLDRKKVTQFLEEKGIQTRLLFAGNIMAHPCFDEMRKSGKGYRVVGNLPNTNRILHDTFWLGVYAGLHKKQLEKMLNVLKQALQ